MSAELTTIPNIEALEAGLLAHPAAFVGDTEHCPLEHHFAPGVYLRTIVMPAGMFIVGHRHRTKHLNIVWSGRARVLIGSEVHEIVGPCTFVSEPGVRKVLLILEEMRWSTIHVTPETDMERLRDELIIPSTEFILHRERELLSADRTSEASQASTAEQPAMPANSTE